MNTQSMPALVRALSGSMPQQAVRQLMQALGNCNQDVNQRGGMNVQPTYRLQNGVANPGTWNPNQHSKLLPNAGSGDFIVSLPGIPGYTNSPWNSVFYGGNQFSFPTSQEFVLNNFYGGPIAQIGGAVNLEFASITNLQPQDQGGDGPSISSPSPSAGGTTVLNQIINQAGSQILPPDLEPPTVLDPIQYVTGVSVFLSKSRKNISLPKNFAAVLTADDFETGEIQTGLSVDGSATFTIPAIPDQASLEGINVTPTSCISIGTSYQLTGSISATDTRPTGLTQDGNPLTLTSTGTAAAMPADATVTGTANGKGSVDLGAINLSIPLGTKAVTIPLGTKSLSIEIPTGFNPDTCSLITSTKQYDINFGDISVNITLGNASAEATLGSKDVNVSVPASGFKVESISGNVSVPSGFTGSLDLSKISVSTDAVPTELDLSGLSISPLVSSDVPVSYKATADNLSISGGNSTNITINGSSFSIASDSVQSVLSGVKPADQLSEPEMDEEFSVLIDATVTTSVGTEFALTTPFGGQ